MKKRINEADVAVDTDLLDMGNAESFITGQEALDKLNASEAGIPVVVRWGKDSDAPKRQSLYMGVSEGTYGDIYNFYDGSGISGYASSSTGFIKDGNIAFDFDNNDANEVARLTNDVKNQGNFEESDKLEESKTFYEIPEDLQKIIDGLSSDVDDPMYDDGYEVPDELLDLSNNPPKNMRVKDWMRIEAPFEYQLDSIPADVTFEDLYNGQNGDFLSDIDSDPRNKVLDILYDIYDLQSDKSKGDLVLSRLGFENLREDENVSFEPVEDRLFDLLSVSSSEYKKEGRDKSVQIYPTDKGNFNLRTPADGSHPMGKDIVTVAYDALIKDEDDEISLKELGYFDDYTNMVLASDGLNEAEIPASNLDFAHQELAIIQSEIEKIAGLKSEDTANDLYTGLLEVLDKAVEVLSDYIAEQPIGTVVGDSEPSMSEPTSPMSNDLPLDNMSMGESQKLTEDEEDLDDSSEESLRASVMRELGDNTSEDEINHELIWSAVCSGNQDLVSKLFSDGSIKPNTRYERFGNKNSLIMGALRNNNFDMVDLLKSLGETILKDELEEYKSIMAKRDYSDDVTDSALDEKNDNK